jgi:hypothetical protein
MVSADYDAVLEALEAQKPGSGARTAPIPFRKAAKMMVGGPKWLMWLRRTVCTARGKLRRKLAEADPAMAKMLEEQTPAQKAWGRMIGKIILARSIDEIEAAFAWGAAEVKEGVALSPTERITALFHATGSMGADEAHYRIIRRMYIRAKMND